MLTPTLSRRSVRPDMAARGLRSAAELAATKPCGTRVRYYAGCRCIACKAANTAYERGRAEARKRGEHNGLVDASQARAHLLKLSRRGVGRKTAADAAKVAASVVSKIIDGQRTRIRAQTEKRILAVTETTAADGARKSARATWRMLDELIDAGYSRARLGSEILGRQVPSLQISRRLVKVKTEARVRAVYDRLRLANTKEAALARARLQELREEGFRVDRIQGEVDRLAAIRGWGYQRIEEGPRSGRWPGPVGLTHRAAVLINAAHQSLTEDLV
jgi:hypothetical protein